VALAAGRGGVGNFVACAALADLAKKRGVRTMMAIPGGGASQTTVGDAIEP